MTSSPITECPDVNEVKTAEHAVHLIVRMSGDWDTDREAMTADLERRTKAVAAYVASPAFVARYAPRIGVVRVQSEKPAPSNRRRRTYSPGADRRRFARREPRSS